MFAYGGCSTAIQRITNDAVNDANVSHDAPVANGASHDGGSLALATVIVVPAVVSAERYDTRGHNGIATYAVAAAIENAYAMMKKL
jgi:hypothetical protein